MRKYARPFAVVALTLAVIICFSGCGIIDFTKSIFHKNNSDISVNLESTQNNGEVIQNNQSVTDSAAILPPSSETSTVPGTSSNAGNSSSGSQNTGSTQSSQNTNTSTTGANKPTVDTTQPITEEDIKDMPVKEVQDLLFATEDPNTAGKILEIAGFEYDEEQGIYYSQMNPLQRKFGFNLVYDMAAPLAGMIYDTKRIEFEYDGREWMVQIWKGQYGITSGAEIGLYNRDPERNFQYDCADDEDLIEMQFDFYNQDEFVFSRGPEKHWWLTGFKVFNAGVPMLIDLDMTLTFTDKQMAQAFVKALKKNVGTSISDFTDPMTYEQKGSTVYIHW